MELKSHNRKNGFFEKIYKFIYNFEKNKKNINILEFGVREGRSTKMFLDMCKENNGKLISVDIEDYSKLFNDQNWFFIKSRDDDYKKLLPYLKNNFDIILIDSLHEPSHVKKLIYLYWKHLKVDGSMYIDDISWLPYLKGNWRDHEHTEQINVETFKIILDILLTNSDNFNLDFNFQDSGMARLTKKNNNSLNDPKNVKLRKNDIKNNLKKFLSFFNKT